jgi:hypothetical protein
MAQIRPLDVRLADYRDALRSLAPQLQDLIDHLPVGADTAELENSMRLYTIVSVDLTKLLDGEELQRFVITGQSPEGTPGP